ncbi:MAG: hypothetical protein DSY33_01920 [Archaeoglobus sp.]|nr:MAG: hypothetical protein DSY33_01920 [Archaeoglobus sp.]
MAALLKLSKRGAVIIFTIIAILLLSSQSTLAFAQADFHAVIVSKVYSYDHYIPRYCNVFKPGSKLKLYLAVKNVNINRAAAVDFVVIIKDPNGYVVYGKVDSVSTLSYKDKIYTVLEVSIPNDWICGRYTIYAYAFDVLNTLPIQVSYNRLYYRILYSNNASPSISTINRKSAPYAKEEINFYVSNVLPKKFYIFNPVLEAKTLPTGVSNTLKVSLLNPTDIDSKTTVEALVDGRVVDSKEVSIPARSVEDVDLVIPPLKSGTHLIKVRASNASYKITLPIVISPLIYDGDVVAGKVLNGMLIYSPNNYILGSGGISSENNLSVSDALNNLNVSSTNRNDAVIMITNMLAYAYRTNHYSGIVNVALLKGSDKKAEKILPVLLDIVKRESHAPIRYVGVRDALHLKDVKILFYVGSHPNFKPALMKYFFENNGTLICDNPDYWTTYKDELADMFYSIGGWKFNTESGLFDSYYNLRIDKGIVVKISTTTEMPTKFEFIKLRVEGPPGTGMPPLVNVSTPINVLLKVRNVGRSGEKKIEVEINGNIVFDKTVFLKTGQSETISFNYTPEKPGSYKVTVPGTSLMQIFFVKSPSGQISAVSSSVKRVTTHRAGAIMVALSAGVLAVLVIVRILLRD